MNYNLPENYEHVPFTDQEFPFCCITINQVPTLPHWHTHSEIIYAEKNTIEIFINGSCHRCPEGDIIFVPGNSLHSIEPSPSAIYTALVIGDDLFDHFHADKHFKQIAYLLSDGSHYNSYHLTPINSYYKELQSHIKKIITETKNPSDYYELQVKVELSSIYSMLIQICPEIFNYNVNENKRTQRMKIAIEYLAQHYAEKITIATMANMMNMSEQHFSRLFKAYTGKTFVDYLTLIRLEQSRKLLIHTDLPITLIPELTGFCNPNYYSRIFKKHFDCSPSSARKAAV